MARLFTNDPDVRFTGRIHEQLCHRVHGEAGIDWLQAVAIQIEHWGYLPGAMEAKGKSERNRALLERVIADDPEDVAGHHYLGMSYASADRPAEALMAFERALALADRRAVTPALLTTTCTLQVTCLVALGRFADALAAADKAVRPCLGEPDYWYQVGLAHRGLDDHPAAIAAFRRCLALRGSHPYRGELATRGWKACLALSESFAALGNREAAMATRWEALRDCHFLPELHGRLWGQAWLDGDAPARQEAHDIWLTLPDHDRMHVAAVCIDAMACLSAWPEAEAAAWEFLDQLPAGHRRAVVVRLAELLRRRGATAAREALLQASQHEPGMGQRPMPDPPAGR
jgi:tetratricopeptide (TPR) repeat protein